MPNKASSKAIVLNPSWKNYLVGYILSVLLIPLFGVGLLILYWVYTRHTKYSYRVTDTQITSRDDKYQQNVDLTSIKKVGIQQSWLQKKLKTGDLILHTSASSMTLIGMKRPDNLKAMLETAIAAEKERSSKKDKSKPRQPEHNPGTMDKMDYLTGLWQQGLVSDEDFEKERKHFE